MITYFANRKMQILGQASTNLEKGTVISSDKKKEQIEGGVVTMEVTIGYGNRSTQEIETWCEAGNYLLRKHDAENEFYTIIDAEIDESEREITLYCEDAGMDLLNAIAEKYEADQAYPAAHYIDKWISGTGFELGTNEISDLTRKLKWDGENTVSERLSSIATQFDNAEISYSFEIEGLVVKRLFVHLWKKRGKDAKVQLRLGRDVRTLRRKTSVADLATALIVTGSTPEGADVPITLQGYSYDDGDLHVVGDRLESRSAVTKWGSLWSGGKHIVRTYSYDTPSQSELCAHAVTELKKRMKPLRGYDVDIVNLPKNCSIGDTVYIVDDAAELYVSGRLMALETSVSTGRITAQLGEFLEQSSGIEDDIQILAAKLAKAAARKAYTLTVTSSGGSIFTDRLIDTVLTAHVYCDGRELSTDEISGAGAIKWYKDGALVHTGKTYSISGVERARILAQLEGE